MSDEQYEYIIVVSNLYKSTSKIQQPMTIAEYQITGSMLINLKIQHPRELMVFNTSLLKIPDDHQNIKYQIMKIRYLS